MLYTKYNTLKNTLNNLEKKYQDNINLDSKKIFLYANAIDFLKYYRLTKFKSFDYDLFNKVTLYKKDLLLLNYINICKENKYYKPNISFLYGIAVSLSVDIAIKNNNLENINPIQLDKYLNKDITVNNNFIKKAFPNSLIMSFTELDFFKEGIIKTHSTVYTSAYIEKAIYELNNVLNHPLFNLKQIILSPFKDESFKFNQFTYNQKRNLALGIELSKKIELESLSKEMLETSMKLIDCINQALYFDKQAPLVEFAASNNWHDIVNYYDYIKARKEEEKQRQLFYKIKQKAKIKAKRKNSK